MATLESWPWWMVGGALASAHTGSEWYCLGGNTPPPRVVTAGTEQRRKPSAEYRNKESRRNVPRSGGVTPEKGRELEKRG